jgi:hypothetical protein
MMRVRKKFPSLLAEDIVTVQPMTAPTDTKFVTRGITEEMKEAAFRFDAACAAVQDFFKSDQGDKWADKTYQIDCPNCDGKLSFGGNSYNGHVHACCSTEGCCSWME